MTELPALTRSTDRAKDPVRLSLATLAAIPARVGRPGFDPAKLRCGIVHLGCGSFHRAHQAALTQVAIEEEARHGCALPAWGITAVSLRTPMVTRALAQQDGLFTVLEHQDQRIRPQVVGTLRQCVFHPEQPGRVREALADPAVRIVTLTITAGGYGLHPCAATLQGWPSEFTDDARRPVARTAIGLLVQGLALRRKSGAAPPVVLSCDNLPANGRLLRTLCIDYAGLVDERLAAWIAAHVQFPCTMVDRIVPPTRAQDLFDARCALGVTDAAPVPAERFHQWVMERFDGPRPRWEAAGAEFVANVAPWEASKLRLLNGGHLAIACLGQLAGCQTVAQAMELPGFRAFIGRFLLDEQRPTLPASDHDIHAYAAQLLRRFCNHGIVHQLSRICRESATKVGPRLLEPLRDNRRCGRPVPCTVLVVAAWMRCAALPQAAAHPCGTEDPVELQLRRCGRLAGEDPDRLVHEVLSIDALFSRDLQADTQLRHALVRAMRALREKGPCLAMAEHMAREPLGCEAVAHAA